MIAQMWRFHTGPRKVRVASYTAIWLCATAYGIFRSRGRTQIDPGVVSELAACLVGAMILVALIVGSRASVLANVSSVLRERVSTAVPAFHQGGSLLAQWFHAQSAFAVSAGLHVSVLLLLLIIPETSLPTSWPQHSSHVTLVVPPARLFIPHPPEPQLLRSYSAVVEQIDVVAGRLELLRNELRLESEALTRLEATEPADRSLIAKTRERLELLKAEEKGWSEYHSQILSLKQAIDGDLLFKFEGLPESRALEWVRMNGGLVGFESAESPTIISKVFRYENGLWRRINSMVSCIEELCVADLREGPNISSLRAANHIPPLQRSYFVLPAEVLERLTTLGREAVDASLSEGVSPTAGKHPVVTFSVSSAAPFGLGVLRVEWR